MEIVNCEVPPEHRPSAAAAFAAAAMVMLDVNQAPWVAWVYQTRAGDWRGRAARNLQELGEV